MVNNEDEPATPARIERQLETLPRTKRATFLLCRLDGLSYYNGSGTLLTMETAPAAISLLLNKPSTCGSIRGPILIRTGGGEPNARP